MKVLNLSIVPLLLCSTFIFANESNKSLEDYISQNKKDQFLYDYKKNEAQSSKLRDSWIAPISLQYSYSKSNPYTQTQTLHNAFIKMDQLVFQSGGIYYGIKFAQASKIYSDYSIDVAKRKLIKDAISLLMQIKQTSLKILRQNLQIKKAEINLELKKEQYINGQLDSGFLDNAVIERNLAIETLYDIHTSKEKLVSKFNTISDVSYKDVAVPHFELLDEKEFLKHNLALDMAKSQIKKDRYNKDVTIAKYLPSLNVVAGYNWDKTENQASSAGVLSSSEKDYYNYGLRASMPLDINTYRDIEISRVEYLKSKVVAQDKDRELRALFEQVIQNIENFDKKIQLSKENSIIYEKLLADTKDLYEAGYKTLYDVEMLESSVEIQKKDLQVYEIDKQLEILSLYEMYKNDI